jgi:hypothetical protein
MLQVITRIFKRCLRLDGPQKICARLAASDTGLWDKEAPRTANETTGWQWLLARRTCALRLGVFGGGILQNPKLFTCSFDFDSLKKA